MKNNLVMTNVMVPIQIDTSSDYGMTSDAYLLQDANVPLTVKKGSIIDILLWAMFWLHLQ